MTKLYQALASKVQAIANCKASDNAAWLERHTDDVETMVKEALLHGSGFDAGTTLDLALSRADRLVFVTAFHHMDEHGGYDGWSEHMVIVTPSLVHGFTLRVTGRNRRDIKDYIAESFEYALSSEEEAKIKNMSCDT